MKIMNTGEEVNNSSLSPQPKQEYDIEITFRKNGFVCGAYRIDGDEGAYRTTKKEFTLIKNCLGEALNKTENYHTIYDESQHILHPYYAEYTAYYDGGFDSFQLTAFKVKRGTYTYPDALYKNSYRSILSLIWRIVDGEKTNTRKTREVQFDLLNKHLNNIKRMLIEYGETEWWLDMEDWMPNYRYFWDKDENGDRVPLSFEEIKACTWTAEEILKIVEDAGFELYMITWQNKDGRFHFRVKDRKLLF